MKFSRIALLATSALTAKATYLDPNLLKRQSDSTLLSDIDAITSAVKSLDSDINSFSGVGDVDSLTSASQGVVSAITQANDAASALSSFPESGISDLLNAINPLIAEVKSTVSDLIGKKSQFAGLGLCGKVLTQVQSQQSAATTFANTLVGKLPVGGLQSEGRMLAGEITSALASASTAFSSCPPSTTSTGSVSTSTAPVSTASGSTSVSTGSVSTGSSTTTATSSSTIAPSTNSTSTSSSPSSTSTITPATGAGTREIVRFGSLLMAAVVAVIAM